MTKFLIILFILLAIPGFAEEKIYIFHLKVSGAKEKDLEKKIRNGLLLSILKQYPGKYKIMDDDSIQDLAKKLEKLQLAGCSEEICIQEISQAIDARDLISGSVIQNGSRINFNLKKVRKDEITFSQTTESTLNEEFDISQLDYFLDESAKKLIEKNYTINRKNAPPSFLDSGDSGIESAKEKPINDIYLSSSHPRNKLLWELLKEPLENAFALRRKGKEKEASKEFSVILSSIEESIPGDFSMIKDLREVLFSKITGGYSRYFAKRIREIDESYYSGKLPENSALDEYKSILTESSEINSSFLPNEKVLSLRFRISKIYEIRGDNEFRDTKFVPAKENFLEAISVLRDKSIIDISKQSAQIATIEKKMKENEETAKRFVENKVRTNCDTSKAQFVFARMNGRSAPEESKKARILGETLLRETEEILKREKEYASKELSGILESARKENY